MIDIRFYQAAVVVIPTLLIAAGFASSVLDPSTRRSDDERRRLIGGWGIVRGIFALCFVIVAELLGLVTLAADEPAVWTFVVILTAITFLAASLATMAMYRLVEPLRGTWLEGVEWLVIFTTSVFAAAAISVALLKG
ncbi:hypothetical protein [Nocardioides sp.]|uniref:hypothetical protein n=1 Tax=Nocardioides sp. TaxID=35761 RepID=UPI0035B18184